ncbi:polycystin-1-like protein 1 [Erethizon dorsatum]
MGLCGLSQAWRVLMVATALLPLVGSTPGISSKGGSCRADCPVRDPRAAAQATGASGDQERSEGRSWKSHPSGTSWARCGLRRRPLGTSGLQQRGQLAWRAGAGLAPHETSVTITPVQSSGGPSSCRWQQCAAGKADGALSATREGASSAAAPCSWWMEVSCCDSRQLSSAEEAAKALLPGTVTTGAPSRVVGSPQASTQPALLGGPSSGLPTIPRSSARPLTPTPTPPGDTSGTPSDTPKPEVSACPHGSLGTLPGAACTPSLPRSPSGPQLPCHPTPCPPEAVPAPDPDDATLPAVHCVPDTDARAPPTLGFRIHLASGVALRLRVDFGDSLGAEIRLRNMTEAAAVTAFHRYGKEGVYVLRAAVRGHQGPEVEFGPYYVAVGRRAVSVLMNSSSVRQDEVLVFAGSRPGHKSTVVMHCLPGVASYNVSFLSRAQAGCSRACPSVTVRYQMQPVSVYTNGTVFATDTDVTFVAVTKETAPLEFTWHFGDSPPVRTTSRSIRRRLSVPQWYRVTVTASGGMGSVVSEPHILKVQRRIEANRLVSAPTALVNTSVAFECRINFGTDVAFRWDFGDGTVSPGGSSASHVYSREGEFTVQVLAFNNISSAALRTQLFVVRQPCQPPPVKNMGPGKVQMWRSQPLKLGVTFEAAVLCDISCGLSYTWSLTDAEGSPIALPAAVDTHRQTLVLPGYTLDSGDYTATAKVQIRGSVVHSNYSVGVEVRARAPVAVISEGTHLFVPRASGAPVILRGTQSYDPDHPGAALSYHWACTAARSPGWPCFDDATSHQLDTSAPTLSFAAERLSRCCEQFLVTLTVASGGWNSSEAQVFLSTREDPAFRSLHIAWVSFKDVSANWNDAFSLHAVCDDCGETRGLSYSWELFWVNATEKSRIEASESKCFPSSASQQHVPQPSRGDREPRIIAERAAAQEIRLGLLTGVGSGDGRRDPAPARGTRCCLPEDRAGTAWTWRPQLVSLRNRLPAVPFCSTVQLLGTVALTATRKLSESDLPATEPAEVHPVGTPTLSPPTTLCWPVLAVPGSVSTGPTVGGHQIPAAGEAMASGEPLEGAPRGPEPATKSPSVQSQPPPSFSPTLDDFEAYYSDIQEAEPARGRQPAPHSSNGPTAPCTCSARVTSQCLFNHWVFEESSVAGSPRVPGTATAPSTWASTGDTSDSGSLPGSGPSAEADAARGSPGDGDSLLGPFVSVDRALPVLAIDWPKAPVSHAVFQSYTTAGVTEPTVTIKPYSLSSGETYVFQASVAAESGLRGRAQLYVPVRRAPQDAACQLQPHRGLEALTVFSIFCTSGTPDLHYKFSYRVGNTSRHTLYRGRDTQYYFALPAGDPLDNYKVMVSTEITDGQGSRIQPCSVVVTVLPRYHGNSCSSEDLYSPSLRNLSTLQLMGSDAESRNYVAMLAGILSRLAKEDTSTSCDLWSPMQEALVSAVCGFATADQLGFLTAARVLRFTRTLLRDQAQFSGRFAGDGGLGLELILLISGVWEASEPGKSRRKDYVHEEGMKVISEALLGALSLSPGQWLSLSAGSMEFRVLLHRGLHSSVQSLGPVLVHLPGDLAGLVPAGEETQSPCYISQLTLFRKSPYPGGQAAGQVGGVVDLTLYSCPTRSPVHRRHLETPMTVEFGDEDSWDNETSEGPFVLLRDRVNIHRFSGLAQHPQESLQIHVAFAKPQTRAFPVLLLVSFSKRPSPSDFLVRQTHLWDAWSVQIYTPAAAGPGANVGYLSLLDADYDRRPPNKHFAEAVNYTVRFQWVRCLLWDQREWRSGSFPPRAGASPDKVNCSYDRLAPFSVLRRKLNASFETSDVSLLQGHPRNLLPSMCVVVFTILYGLAVMKSRLVDGQEEKKAGCIFLQEATPPGHQLYAVVVDTGFWAPARFTSRVFIVLCGESGLSETKELCCPEGALFERNSRHTFILSTPAQLGQLRKVRLWHDNSGPAPSWLLSCVMVKELRSGQAWFFPARCWLAVGRGDGCVERELPCLHRGLGFQKYGVWWSGQAGRGVRPDPSEEPRRREGGSQRGALWGVHLLLLAVCHPAELFYAKFAESLESHHAWLSLCSPPGSRGPPRTQRLAVCFCLLCTHACLTALATAGGQGQLPLDVGPTDLPLGALSLGLLCALVASSVAQLLSLLLGHSKQPATAVVSGSDTACPAPELEAGRVRNRSHRGPPASQAPRDGREGLAALGSRACPLWPRAAAWTVCSLVSLACGLGTGFLGYRFLPAQCTRWLLLLSLSVVFCAFITQPLLICCAALGFAWKRRDDSQCFAESLHEATRNLGSGREERPGWHIPAAPGRCTAGRAVGLAEVSGDAVAVLAARQQERHLRWARPPSKAQLRATRERMRRESRMQAALRDITVHVLMLLLLLWTTYGTFPADAHSLSRAIRREFVRASQFPQPALRMPGRVSTSPCSPMLPHWDLQNASVRQQPAQMSNARYSLGSLSHTGDWSTWRPSAPLDGLHTGGPSMFRAPGAQPGALEGKFYLLGALVIKQLKVSPGSLHKRPGNPGESGRRDIPSSSSGRLGAPDGPRPVSKGWEAAGRPGLAFHRLEAHAVLTTLRTSGWMDSSTGATSVHLALYHPATQLFASVTLSVDALPTGKVVPSAWVESFRVFRGSSAPWYHSAFPEGQGRLSTFSYFGPFFRGAFSRSLHTVTQGHGLQSQPQAFAWLAFLVLSLAHLSLQLYEMAEVGTLSYWRKPRNWLELPAVGVALAYYMATGLLTGLAGDVADQIRQGPCRAPLDLRPMALWSQRARWLQGLLLLLWTLKCVSLPGLLNVATSCCCRRRMQDSASSISTPGMVGALLLAAHVHLRHLLCALWALPPRTFAHLEPRLLLLGFPGRSQEDWFPAPSASHQQATAECLGALSIVTATLCLGMAWLSVLGPELPRTPQARAAAVTAQAVACSCGQEALQVLRKSFHGKLPVRLEDIAVFAWRKTLTFLGLAEPALEEAEVSTDPNHYLDEFASLLDELLLKINTLSDSLELPAVEEPRAAESKAEDGPVVSTSGYQATGPHCARPHVAVAKGTTAAGPAGRSGRHSPSRPVAGSASA